MSASASSRTVHRTGKRWQPPFFRPGCAVLAVLLFAWPAQAQHDWQKPNPLIARAEVEKIIGPVERAEPDRDLRIVWVWGRDTSHGPGAHEYVRVRDAMVALLSQVPRVTVETARGFPKKEKGGSHLFHGEPPFPEQPCD